MRKIYILAHSILAFALCSCGQSNEPKNAKEDNSTFSLSLSVYNHAERLFNGTTIYSLTNDSLIISKHFMFSEKDTIVLSKRVNPATINQIKQLRLDTLQDFYINNCIMLTSGNEYYISMTNDSVIHETSLHHYYHEQVEKLILELNNLIPKKYQLNYLPKSMEQDCEL